jgi:molybdopterin-guanine dinucleotide biosynthesis protein B
MENRDGDGGHGVIPVISIVGRSGMGKTTLIENVIPELKRRGYRVATIKHDVHGFEIDHKGKDSWRHKNAGATMVIISSPTKIALIRDSERDHSLEEVISLYVRNVDIVISEGYKRSSYPKIEVFRKGIQGMPMCKVSENLIAIVGDVVMEVGVPWFHISDVKGIVDFIERSFLKR